MKLFPLFPNFCTSTILRAPAPSFAITVEQLPQIAPPAPLEPPPPPPVPQKTTGTSIPPTPPVPDLPRIGLAHGFQWCFLLPVALNLFLSAVIALVSGLVIPLLVALAGLTIPIVGYAIERRVPANTLRRFSIAFRVLLAEVAFFMAWEVGMYIWWPRAA